MNYAMKDRKFKFLENLMTIELILDYEISM